MADVATAGYASSLFAPAAVKSHAETCASPRSVSKPVTPRRAPKTNSGATVDRVLEATEDRVPDATVGKTSQSGLETSGVVRVIAV